MVAYNYEINPVEKFFLDKKSISDIPMTIGGVPVEVTVHHASADFANLIFQSKLNGKIVGVEVTRDKDLRVIVTPPGHELNSVVSRKSSEAGLEFSTRLQPAGLVFELKADQRPLPQVGVKEIKLSRSPDGKVANGSSLPMASIAALGLDISPTEDENLIEDAWRLEFKGRPLKIKPKTASGK